MNIFARDLFFPGILLGFPGKGTGFPGKGSGFPGKAQHCSMSCGIEDDLFPFWRFLNGFPAFPLCYEPRKVSNAGFHAHNINPMRSQEITYGGRDVAHSFGRRVIKLRIEDDGQKYAVLEKRITRRDSGIHGLPCF